MNKLINEEKVVLGYLGGSITEGEGASTAELCWRAVITQWFRQHFPNTDFVEINAAIGGTGSDLACFRCQQDLLSYKPNLVFIEFAVNDANTAGNRVMVAMEGIVRQILKKNVWTDIVFVYTTTRNMAEKYYNEELEMPSVVLHQKVAHYYQIPSVSAGKVVWEKVKQGRDDWNELLVDGVHPSDAGYVVYARQIQEFLEECLLCWDEGIKDLHPKSLHTAIADCPLEDGHLLDAWYYQQPGWYKRNESLSKRYPHMLVCDEPGTVLKVKFLGNIIGMYYLIAADSGDLEWSIDGSPFKVLSTWDQFALKFTRAGYFIFSDDLLLGEHELEIRVLKERQAQSKGNWIRIGAFLEN